MLVKSLPNENGVLAALTPTVYARLTPNLKRVRLEAGSTLFDIGSTSDPAWFITKGIASLFTTTEAGDIVEAASVGRAWSASPGSRKEPEWPYGRSSRFQARRFRSA